MGAENNPEWKSTSHNPMIGQDPFGYQQTLELNALLSGKRVAYICPAPSLIGTNLGEYIDSFDIVIRAGNLSPVPEHLHADYGSRTDILVHSFNHLEIDQAKRNMAFLRSLKYVLCPMVSTSFLSGHEAFFSELRSLGVPTENVDDRYLFTMFKQIGTIANVGLSGLVTVLNYDLKDIFYGGSTFYNMGQFGKCYNDSYYRDVTIGSGLYDYNDRKETSYEQARGDLHDQPSQIAYFDRIVKSDSRIMLDPYLKQRFPTPPPSA